MYKRLLSLLLVTTVVLVALLSACAKPSPTSTPAPAPATTTSVQPSATTTTSAPTTTAAPKPSPTTSTAAPAQPAQVFKWRMQANTATSGSAWPRIQQMVKEINETSNGRLAIEAFPVGAILPGGSDDWAGLMKGTVEMYNGAYSFAVSFFPQAGLFQAVSGGLTTTQQFMWFISGGGDQLANKLINPKGLVHVSMSVASPAEVWAHSKVEIKTVADLKGKKFRTIGDGGEILKTMGVEPTVIAYTDVYESMKRGVIDMCEVSTAGNNWDTAFQEIAPYMYMSPSRNPTDTLNLIANADAWAKLSPDLQLLIKRVTQSEVMWFFAEQTLYDTVAVQKFKDYGTKVIDLPKDVEDAYMAAAKKFYETKSASDPLFGEIFKSISDWQQKMKVWAIQ